MIAPGTKAELFLNGQKVGNVVVRATDASWVFGDFTPEKAFGQFAPLYGRWSLLMHAEGEIEPLSAEAKEALRDAETEQYRVHAELFFPQTNERHKPALLNIDGELVEWKMY